MCLCSPKHPGSMLVRQMYGAGTCQPQWVCPSRMPSLESHCPVWFFQMSKLPELTQARLKESIQKRREASGISQKRKKLNTGKAKPSPKLAAFAS